MIWFYRDLNQLHLLFTPLFRGDRPEKLAERTGHVTAEITRVTKNLNAFAD